MDLFRNVFACKEELLTITLEVASSAAVERAISKGFAKKGESAHLLEMTEEKHSGNVCKGSRIRDDIREERNWTGGHGRVGVTVSRPKHARSSFEDGR